MHVLMAHRARIPVYAYGGTERVIWDLGAALVRRGHQVSYLVPEGSTCEFATHVLPIDVRRPWRDQIPADVDVVHFQFDPELADDEALGRPYVFTEHAVSPIPKTLPLNTVFLSRDHAARHGSIRFVHNGLDWAAYGPVDLARRRDRHHYLGKASRAVKNVAGAIAVARRAGVELDVLGGNRISIKAGFRLTLSPRIHFHGMVGGERKFAPMNASRGLICPVRWHEPFGLMIIESLYFGCPVFATPYGAIPELVPDHLGALAADAQTLAEAIRERSFDPAACHDHALGFSAERMTDGYLDCYERVLAGESLNPAPPSIGSPEPLLPWSD